MDKVEMLLLSIVLVVMTGTYYGTYKYGRQAERKALTAALVDGMREAYYEGRTDGVASCFVVPK